MKSKTIPYGRHFIIEEDISRVEDVLRSDWITQGKKIDEFEKAISRYCRSKYAVAVSSGTAALHTACLAAGIKNNDEVITSPITFVASANSVLYCGGKPVFADIETETANIDVGEIKKKITCKTRAIIPVHYAGHPCDMEEIKNIARKNNLLIIEDAAHAFGAEYKKSKIGSSKYSDMTIFSFHPIKSITTGEGGAVLTNNVNLYKKLLLLRSHGITKDPKEFFLRSKISSGPWQYEMQALGFNYRLTDFQCALGISQLKKINAFIKRRAQIAAKYSEALSDIDEIIIPAEKTDVKSSWHLYYVRIRDHSKRKRVFEMMRKAGIGVQVHYIPVYYHPFYRQLGYGKQKCINAENFYDQEISLPIYYGMTDDNVDYVIGSLKNAIRSRKS